MPAPINYMQYMPQVDLAQKFGQGFSIGNAIQNAPIQREALELQNQAVQQELQQRELQLQKQQQYEQDLQKYWENPTVEGAARLATAHPGHGKVINDSWQALDAKAKENDLKAAVPIYSALLNGNSTVALDLVNKQIEATKNANQDPSSLEAYRDMIEKDPKSALAYGGTYLSAIQGADKFAKTFGDIQAIENLPLQQNKILSEINLNQARTQNEFSDIEIKKEANRIKAMEAQYKREDNDLKREELQLKIEDAKQKLEDKRSEKTQAVSDTQAKVDSARDSALNTMATIDRVLANKSLDDVVGSLEGRLPSYLDDEESSAIADLETIKSQTFLSAVPLLKGTGQLSNAEGAKLEASIASLDRVQSEPQLRANLKIIRDLTEKGLKNIQNQYAKKFQNVAPNTNSNSAPSKGASGAGPMKPAGVSQSEWDQYLKDRGYK